MKRLIAFVTIDKTKYDSVKDFATIKEVIRKGIFKSLDKKGISVPSDTTVRVAIGGTAPEYMSLDEANDVIKQQAAKIKRLESDYNTVVKAASDRAIELMEAVKAAQSYVERLNDTIGYCEERGYPVESLEIAKALAENFVKKIMVK